PDGLAANICREMALATNDYEVAFVDGTRHLQVALAVPAKLETHPKIRRGGTWVLTGGARGVTAACGMELGRRFGLKLHLIGTTPIDHLDPSWRTLDETRLGELRSRIMIEARGTGQTPSEAWARISKAIEIDRNLQTFADAGIPATYHACDAGDREALARVLAQVRAKDGPIDGILHGAAIEQSCRYEKKNRQ